ncbi:autotransporter domain-containing protein [Pseudovibrio sp. JE062]|uniref:autotransporter domain-containing protein n=1 Tax=Pseudovibrio sp. JE062 TaxID=439495 RepID=UPI000186C1C6|nr:autotransporter domain-containing protein [Pseudovibrio sp. JE062]EEA94733.1 serine proteinase, putative [Pseudovibrio sp. JE062]
MWYSERLLGTTALAGLAFACLFSLQVERVNAQTVITGTINNPPFTINGTNGLRIGQNGADGTLNVFSGTTVPIGQLVEIGVANANGTLNVYEGASVTQSGNFVFIEVGNGFNEGTINLYESGQLFAPTGDIVLEGQGTINIGGEENAAARSAGYLRVDDIYMLNGSKIVINTTSSGGNHLMADLVSVSSGSGEVLFENGTTQITNNNSRFSGKMFFEENATAVFTGTNAVGNAQLDFVGGKVVTTGSTTISGDIEVTNVGAVNDATFETSNGNLTLSGDIIGNGKVRFEGNGITTLSGNNTWTGGADIDGTEVVFSTASHLGSGPIELNSGHLTFSGTTATVNNLFDLDGTSSMEVGSGDTLTVSNDISGSGRLKKLGDGTLVLGGTGSNFSGGLDLADGTVQFGSAASIGSGNIIYYGGDLSFVSGSDATISNTFEMHNNGTLDVQSGRTLTITGNIVNGGGSPGKLTIGSGGTVDLQGTNSFSGGLVVQENSTVGFSDSDDLGSGTVELDNGNLTFNGTTATISNLIDLDGTSSMTVGTGDTLTVSNDISGSGRLKKFGDGTLVLGGAGSSFSGGLDLAEGTVQFGAAANIGTGNIIYYGGDLSYVSGSDATLTNTFEMHNDGTLDVQSGRTLTITGNVIDGGGSPATLTIGSGGTVNLRGSNTFSGGLVIQENSTVGFADSNDLGTGDIGLDSGNLSFIGTSATITNNLELFDDSTIDLQSGRALTISGNITDGDGTPGMLTIGSGGTVNLGGTNTFTAGLTVQENSTVGFTSASNLGTGNIALNNGNLIFNGTTATIANGFDLTGTSAITVGSGDTLTASNDISGTGLLKKLGTGTLVLGGATSNFSGGLDLAAGTVEFGAAANIGTGEVLFYGGDLSYVSGSDATITNNFKMHDDGTLDVQSGRTLTLTGDITDGGSSPGTLTIGSGGTVNLQGDNSFSGGLIVQENSSVEFTDPDRLGLGTTTLSNGNLLYQGTTDVNLSRIAIASGTSNTIDIDDNTVDLEISSNLSGSGNLSIDGGQTATLTGTNSSWTGDLGITDTELIFNDGANIGNGNVGITLNSSTLTYTGGSTVTINELAFSGTGNVVGTTDVVGQINIMSGLTGSDQVTFTGPGEVNLLGDNSDYSADIEIDSGTVGLEGFSTSAIGSGDVIINGGTLFYLGTGSETVDTTKLQVNSNDNAIDMANAGASLTWTGNASPGGGTFLKNGAGTLILSDGTKSLVSSTINGGTMRIGASSTDSSTLAGSLTVNSDGRLEGYGTVSGSVTLNGGIIAPGASFGTITLGSLDATGTGGTLEMEIGSDPVTGMANADQIEILAGGSVDLTGVALDLVNVAGPTPVKIGDEFVIIDNLSVGGSLLTGTFSSVSHDMFMLDVNVLYGIPGDDNDVAIQFIRSSNNFNGLATTRNEHSVTLALDTINESGDLFTHLAPMNNAQIKALLDPLSGEINASTRAILLADSRFLRQAVNDRLYKAHSAFASEVDDDMVTRTVGDFEMWGQVYGSWGEFFSDGNARTTGRSVGGVLVGVDATYFDMVQLGVVAGFGRTSIDISSIDASSDSDSYSVGGYASANPIDNVKLRGGVAGTWYNIATDRDVALFPEETLSADQFAGSVQVFGELGYTLESTYGNLEPFAGVAYAYLTGPGFNESGGAAALKADSQSNSLTFLTLGTRGEFDLSNYLYGDTSFVGLAAWQYASAETLDYTQSFIDSGNPFTVASVPIARNVALIETGLQSNLTEHIQLNVNYYGLLSDEAVDHGANARLFVQY